MKTPVLVIDDDQAMGEFLTEALARWDFEVVHAPSAEQGLQALQDRECLAVVTDVRMKGLGGIELARTLSESHPELPVLVMTAFGSIESAVEAMRAGAYDFLTKPIETEVLARALRRAVEHRSLQDEVVLLRRVVEEGGLRDGLLGKSEPMAALFRLLERIQDAEAPVLILGETGSGKELVARSIHDRSPFAEGAFVPINCAAMPGELLESELFGHEKGAFTGAHRAKEGLLRQADGGTLFLDEVGELPLELQPKLLRVLQEQKVRPVGGTREIAFRTRVLSATHRDLESRIEDGRFRQDLFYRLNVLQVCVPPLRERGTDVLLLAEHFLAASPAAARKKVCAFTREARARMMAYSWPGNVRELHNCVERAIALAVDEEVGVDDLPERVVSHSPHEIMPRVEVAEALPTMDEVEERYVRQVIEATGGNKTRAAKILGFDRKTLYRKLERYGIGAEP